MSVVVPANIADLFDIPVAATTVVRMKMRGGEVVQKYDVYIGRAQTQGGWKLPRSKWANPFTARECGSVGAACERYKKWIESQPALKASVGELRGKVLGCWCKPGPCHGDVLAELADGR